MSEDDKHLQIARPEPIKLFVDAAKPEGSQWWRQVLSVGNGAFILSLKNGDVPPPPENALSSEFQEWLLTTIDNHIKGKERETGNKYDNFHEINPAKAGLILSEYAKSTIALVKADRENREELAIERYGEIVAYSTLLDAFGMTNDARVIDALCSWMPGLEANTRINRIMGKLYQHKDGKA